MGTITRSAICSEQACMCRGVSVYNSLFLPLAFLLVGRMILHGHLHSHVCACFVDLSIRRWRRVCAATALGLVYRMVMVMVYSLVIWVMMVTMLIYQVILISLYAHHWSPQHHHHHLALRHHHPLHHSITIIIMVVIIIIMQLSNHYHYQWVTNFMN